MRLDDARSAPSLLSTIVESRPGSLFTSAAVARPGKRGGARKFSMGRPRTSPGDRDPRLRCNANGYRSGASDTSPAISHLGVR